MFSLNNITNGCVTTETPENGQHSQKISTFEMPVFKMETPEPSSNPAGCQQTISLPQESLFDVRSLREINLTEDDVLKIQITNVQGASSDKNIDNPNVMPVKQKENQVNNISNRQMQSTFHIGTQGKTPMPERVPRRQISKIIPEKKFLLEAETRSSVKQSSVHSDKALSEVGLQKYLPSQINSDESNLVPSRHLSDLADIRQVSSQFPLLEYQTNRAMSEYHANTQGTLSTYQNGTPDSVSSPRVSTNMAAQSVHMTSHVTVPLYHIQEKTSTSQNSTDMAPPLVYLNSHVTVPLHHLEEKPLSQTGEGENSASFKANYHAGMSKYYGDYSIQDLQRGMPFWQTEIRDVVPDVQRSESSCQCCCHGQTESPRLPDFDPKSQRPSVIMVPVSWSSSDSGTSHLPLQVDTTTHMLYSEGYLPSREGMPDGMHYLSDSDSSDDGENGKEKYFRKNIDGTTARFKLTKEDWARIPINTFPSGGRLLSGDWTKIFLSKVKESNPWCSLRFKNNHVRSENSRKIHSAVFFRGGAECKRPECNVKVRFVIRKEKGKHVDVTYVGDVCHSSEPGGSDVTSNRKRLNRVRRTYST